MPWPQVPASQVAAAQAAHRDAPLAADAPAGQSAQPSFAVPLLYLPDSQETHATPSVVWSPGPQGRHVRPRDEYQPASQSTHTFAPSASSVWYWPSRQ